MCVCVQKCNEGIDGLDALWLKLDHVRSSYNESNVQSHHERPLPGGKIHHISRSGEKGVGIELKEKKEAAENYLSYLQEQGVIDVDDNNVPHVVGSAQIVENQ